MIKTIMLIPLSSDCDFTLINLVVLNIICKKFKEIYFFNPIVLNKNFSLYNKKFLSILKFLKCKINLIDPIQINKILQNNISIEKFEKYVFLILERYYSCIKKKNIVTIITGIPIKSIEDINYSINLEIAKNINAEIIFLNSVHVSKKIVLEKYISKIYKKYFLIHKLNIIGIIFNIFKNKKKFLQKNILCINSNLEKKNIESFIQKNKFLINTSSIPILGMHNFNLQKKYIPVYFLIKLLCAKFIFQNCIKMQYITNIYVIQSEKIQNISIEDNTLLIIDLTCINDVKTVVLWMKKIKNNAIILFTNSKYLKMNIINNIDYIKNSYTDILYTKFFILEVCNVLQKFNFNFLDQTQNNILKQIYTYSKYINSKKIFLHKNKFIDQISSLSFRFQLRILSSKKNKKIIFPEGNNPNIIKAVSICSKLKISNSILLGDPKIIMNIAKKEKIHLGNRIRVINPKEIRKKYINTLIKLRKSKGINKIQAKILLKNNIILANLMLKNNEADGLVGGIENTTADIIRPSFQLIKCKPIYSLISSCFFMLFKNKILLYSDCAINPNPTSSQLAEIAIQTAETACSFNIKPRIAMISYSTGCLKNSHFDVIKVYNAVKIVKKIRPDLLIEGPIQYDAAISSKVCKIKLVNSVLKGKANIFIFPDLDTANTTYKAVQRSSEIVCIGPILQGINKPVNDLSRGASIEDIVYTIAVTCIQ
ncbi:phosphate acetyltransferase [Buchnera aphidicola (Kurisakia onigurumii)]|uniref:phosphate acetyltransferase n=1 Tax=Buchnera aphidicola TaxID=9 RepID=UPI0031B69413